MTVFLKSAHGGDDAHLLRQLRHGQLDGAQLGLIDLVDPGAGPGHPFDLVSR